MPKKLTKEEKGKLYAKEMLANLRANVLEDQLSDQEKANFYTDGLLEETLKEIKRIIILNLKMVSHKQHFCNK